MRISDPSTITPGMELFVARVDDDKSAAAVHKIKVVECPASDDPDVLTFKYQTFQTNGIYCLAITMQDQTWNNQSITSAHGSSDEYNVRMDAIGIVPNLNTFSETFDNLNEAKYYIGHMLGLNTTSSAYDDYDRAMKVI